MSSGEYWMGMSREEYMLLSYILLQIGPEGEAVVDPERAAEAIGVDPQRVRELLESLQRKRLISIVEPRRAESLPISRMFEAFRDPQAGPEGFSYFRREVRSTYLSFTRSLRELVQAEPGPGLSRALSRTLFYNARLEHYRALGEITLSSLEAGRPYSTASFEEALKALYRASLYLYPIVTLLSRPLETPWGERITVYVPSGKALQARMRSIEEHVAGVERLLASASDVRLRRGLSILLAGLKRDKSIIERFSGILEEIEGVLWAG